MIRDTILLTNLSYFLLALYLFSC